MDCICPCPTSTLRRQRTSKTSREVLRQPRLGDSDSVQRVLPVPRGHVRFSNIVTVYQLPSDDRRSPWMRVALDRRRFERRIRETENILQLVFSV